MRSSDASSPVPLHFVSFVPRYHRVGAWFARCVVHPSQRQDLVSGLSIPRVSVKTTRPPRFPGAPMHVRHVLGPRLDLGLSHNETSTSSSPNSTVDNSNDPTPSGGAGVPFEARSHGFALPVYASWPTSPLTTQHSVPAGLLGLAGQVHLLLGHFTRFQLCFMRPPRPSSSGATNHGHGPSRGEETRPS
jgi:hypothetical protein